MKNGLLVSAPRSKWKNIGDYIQSIAQEQFFDHIDCFVEREKLSLYQSDEKTKVIMNAWFMWEPEHFPPSKDIDPLFISFHVVPKIAHKLLSLEVISYLKNFEPIGTRDTGTKELLESYGIKCYFSGCLTLTLGLRYTSVQKDGAIYFVDPYYEMCGIKSNLLDFRKYFKVFCSYLRYRNRINSVLPHFNHEFQTVFGFISKKLENRLCAASFYKSYHGLFSDEILINSKFVTHNIRVTKNMDDNYLLKIAKDLVEKYAKASLVITSRIHCGLPCLGIGTPTLFITSDVLEGNSLRSSGRFGGLLNLFHTIKWTKDGLVPISTTVQEILIDGKFPSVFALKNKSDYRELRDNMIKKVNGFINKQ